MKEFILPRVGTGRYTPSDFQCLKTDFGKYMSGPTTCLAVFPKLTFVWNIKFTEGLKITPNPGRDTPAPARFAFYSILERTSAGRDDNSHFTDGKREAQSGERLVQGLGGQC